MTLTNLSIKDLFEGKKLTFLVGAGCSVDAPSCLADGRTMIESIVKYTCAASEIQKILNLKGLRFEQLVEIVRDRVDKQLRIIDYYGESHEPNLQHLFLASEIKKGNFVMTTNFDFLIECALLKSGVFKKNIIPVITEKEFTQFNDPNELFKEGKKVVYKIHGSTKNIITEENTRDSLIATIQALGSGKDGESVFQIEPFKRPLFYNISHKRSLVVMGYSGSDDFDIVPTLQVLKNLKNVIWINYRKEAEREEIHEIDEVAGPHSGKVHQILADIRRLNNAEHVYRVDVNTTKMVMNLIDAGVKAGTENFTVTPTEWLEKEIKKPTEFQKFQIPYKNYYHFGLFDDAMNCCKEILTISERKKNKKWKGIALNNIGLILKEKGDWNEALTHYQEAMEIDEQLGDLDGKATGLNNIGSIFEVKGEFDEALKHYKEAMEILEQIGNLKNKASCLNNIGMILKVKGELDEALTHNWDALVINEKLGDLLAKAVNLNNIGSILKEKGELDEALKRFQEALEINEQLSYLNGKATSLNNIGSLLDDKGEFDEALKHYREAMEIEEQLGNVRGRATGLNNIGFLLKEKGKLNEALMHHQEALENFKQLGDPLMKAVSLINIGNTLEMKGDLDEALKYYKEALKIFKELGSRRNELISLNNIGNLLRKKGKLEEAMNYFLKALEIDEQIGDLSGKIADLNNVGSILHKMGKLEEAMNYFLEALEINEQIGDLSGKISLFHNIGMIYYEQENYLEALNHLEKSLQILIDFGLSDSQDARAISKNIDRLKNKTRYRPQRKKTSKVGRNDPCPCGSGKKYKKCCLNK